MDCARSSGGDSYHPGGRETDRVSSAEERSAALHLTSKGLFFTAHRVSNPRHSHGIASAAAGKRLKGETCTRPSMHHAFLEWTAVPSFAGSRQVFAARLANDETGAPARACDRRRSAAISLGSSRTAGGRRRPAATKAGAADLPGASTEAGRNRTRRCLEARGTSPSTPHRYKRGAVVAVGQNKSRRG